MTKKLCALCKKEIIGYREISYAKFCSNECYIKNTRINASKVSHLRRKKQEDKECIICKKKYTPIRFTQKTCSSDCRFIHTKNLQKKGRKKLEPVNCVICNKKFQPKNRLHINCSPQCQKIDYHNKEIIRNTKRRKNRKNIKIDKNMVILGIMPTDMTNVKTTTHTQPKFCNSTENSHSELKNKVEDFIKNGGKIERLPDENEWPMFPFNDTLKLNTKRILDYERDHKSRREETV
tara:strand:+ start:140 stop:844 length:705 start_codon:yes stop_codon:yes gene_type:complete